MSGWAKVPHALLGAVPDAAVVLYACVASYQRDNDNAWPSQATVAERLGWSVSKVYRTQGALEESGWMTVHHRAGRSSLLAVHLTPVTSDRPTPVTSDRPTPVTSDRQKEKQVNEKQVNEKVAPVSSSSLRSSSSTVAPAVDAVDVLTANGKRITRTTYPGGLVIEMWPHVIDSDAPTHDQRTRKRVRNNLAEKAWTCERASA